MKDNLKYVFIKYGYAAFLGGALGGLLGITVFDWRFYVIMIPSILLAEMKVFHNDK